MTSATDGGRVITTYPKNQALRAPAHIAKSGREVNRAHARLDQDESTLSQHTAQIATANTNIATNTTNIATNTTDITANTTAITAVNTGSGGTAQENFLGSLQQMSFMGNESGSGVGMLSYSGASGWNNSAVDDYNALNTAFNNLVGAFNILLSELQAGKFMNP